MSASTEQSVSTTNYYKEELFMSKITEEFKEFIMRGNVMVWLSVSLSAGTSATSSIP